MTRPRGELTTYRARGGHATDWANPTQLEIKRKHLCSYSSYNNTDQAWTNMKTINWANLNSPSKYTEQILITVFWPTKG